MPIFVVSPGCAAAFPNLRLPPHVVRWNGEHIGGIRRGGRLIGSSVPGTSTATPNFQAIGVIAFDRATLPRILGARIFESNGRIVG